MADSKPVDAPVAPSAAPAAVTTPNPPVAPPAPAAEVKPGPAEHVLTKNHGWFDGFLHRFLPKGHVLAVGKDDAVIAKLYAAGAGIEAK